MEGKEEAIRKEGRDDEGKTNLDLIEWDEEEPEQANIIEAIFLSSDRPLRPLYDLDRRP